MTLKASAQGSLAKTPFAHLLLYIQGKRLTGTLAVWPESPNEKQGKSQDRVLFHEGGIVAVRPLEPADSALAAVIRLFRRHDAPYAFYDAQNLLGTGEGALNERVDLYMALSRGLRDTALDDAMGSVLGRLLGRPLRIRAGVPVDRLDLNGKELALIETMRAGPATIDELIAGSELAPKDTKRLLYLLTLIRGVEASDGASIQPPSDPLLSMRPPVPERSPLRGSQGDALPPSTARAPTPSSARAQTPAPPPRPSQQPRGMPLGVPVPNNDSMPAPPAPTGLGPLDDQRWAELSMLYDKLDELNHFELLGIAPNSNYQEISNAYFARVKKFHPDRLPSSLAPILRCAQKVFDRLTEANETLSNDELRAEYVRTVAAGGGTRASERMMRDVLASSVEFQKAEVLMRKRDLPQAMAMLRSALNKNPNESDYLALYAWLLNLMNPAEPAPFDEMVRSLDKALQDNPRNERAHYYKGVVLKRMKRDNEAVRHFQKAIEINPRNVDAAREVRIAGMRRDSKPPPPAASGKLLSRLFGNKDRDE